MRSPTTAAVDRIVDEIVAPGLKPVGFRRNGQHWTHSSDTSHRDLRVQRSRSNSGDVGRFTLNLWLAFGERSGRTHRIGGLIAAGRDTWWEVQDPADPANVDRFVRGFAQDWDDQILPVVEAATSPEQFCLHLVDHAALRGVEVAFGYARAIGDPVLVERAYERSLELARLVEPWPLTPDGRMAVTSFRGGRPVSLTSAENRLQPVFTTWTMLARMGEIAGSPLGGPDRDRAVEALRWALDLIPRPDFLLDELRSFAASLGVEDDRLNPESGRASGRCPPGGSPHA